MTYKELAEKILTMPEARQKDDVTVVTLDSGEVLPSIDFVTDWIEKPEEDYNSDEIANGVDMIDGVLDEGHPYLTVAY